LVRARIHSRDIQPLIAAPKGLFAAARVQRLDFPLTINTTNIDELGNPLHVGTTSDIPEVTVTFEAFDVSHNTFAYLTGYTPGTYPASGASVTELKNIDVIGSIRDNCGDGVVSAIYVKRGIVTSMSATFGVQDNSTVSYTVNSNSKKALRQPVHYDNFTTTSGTAGYTLSQTPTYLTRTSGYILSAYVTGDECATNYLTEGTDFTVSGTTLTLTAPTNGTLWVTYASPAPKTFETLDTTAPAAIQGKYVPVTISVSNISRVQSATINATFESEQILEMGGLGKPVGYELNAPDVTGDISVLKTDNDLLALLEGVPTTTVENDIEYALTSLPLKVQLKDPRNPSRVVLTYYVPSITITAQGDESTVNASINETFSWRSTTGQLYVASGVGPW
jgi:hypothetical protein